MMNLKPSPILNALQLSLSSDMAPKDPQEVKRWKLNNAKKCLEAHETLYHALDQIYATSLAIY